MARLLDCNNKEITVGDTVAFALAYWAMESTSICIGEVAEIIRTGGGTADITTRYGLRMVSGHTNNNAAEDGGVLLDVLILMKG